MTPELAIGRSTSGTSDERVDRRYRGRMLGFLLVDGACWRCWIRDISIGGAGVEPPIPAALGKVVELRSPKFDFEGGLVGRVVNLAHGRTCIAFDFDAKERERLAGFLDSVTV